MRSKKICSLRTQSLIESVFEAGKQVRGKHITLWVCQDKVEPPKDCGFYFGLVVSRRISRLATKRNLWKRRLREAFRALSADAKRGIAVVVMAKQAPSIPSYAEIKDDMASLLKKARCLK